MKNANNSLKRKPKRTYQIMCLLFCILMLCCMAWLAAYFVGLEKAQDEMNRIMGSYVSDDGPQSSGSAGGTVSSTGTDAGSGMPDSGSGNLKDDMGTGLDTESSGAGSESENPENAGEADDLSVYGITDRVIDWEALQEEENKDIYSWIVVPGTAIDYPVLQHPTEMDYYLEHNLDGSTGRPGCIYTQRMNSKDWSDRNTVLYGHNMRVGTMFAGLHDFEDADFFEDNRYIHIYTEDGRILIYEIFAAYAFSDAHILLTYDFNTDTGYQQYLDSIWENKSSRSQFRQETVLSAEDKIITLSTCIRGSSSQRYLVQGVLIAEGEQQ